MKAGAFSYHDPTTVSEALALLDRLEDAQVLAGGQSLVPALNFRTKHPRHLIDLNAIPELAGMNEQEGCLVAGAMTRQRNIAESPVVARACPIAQEALRLIGHLATRTRGTLGGSLCNMDPCAELYAVSALHDAVLQVRSARGEREIPLADWPQAYMTPALASNELLCQIRWHPWPAGHGHAMLEFSQRHHDYAIAVAGALMTVSEDERIEQVAIVVAGVSIAPVRLAQAEAMLLGERGDAKLFARAAETAALLDSFPERVAESGYPRRFVSAAYRQHLAVILTHRALELAWTRANRGKEPTNNAA